jgi:hypothetical protein
MAIPKGRCQVCPKQRYWWGSALAAFQPSLAGAWGAAGGVAGLGGTQSPQTNILLPASLRKDPKERGLCKPHLAQLMLALPEDCAKGEPEARER